MPQIYNMGPPVLLTPRRRRVGDFFALKDPNPSAEFEPENLVTRGQHASSRPPKPLVLMYSPALLFQVTAEIGRRNLLRNDGDEFLIDKC
jgi:hypothetical protein